MSNERPVATDALATLGTIIDDKQKRDAIHIAVEPVIAGERLQPGCHITVLNGVAYASSWEDSPDPGGEPLGIVDPFLTKSVKKGERFWFLMYPRMVTSLRHVWAHPAFPDEVGTTNTVGLTKVEVTKRDAGLKEASEKWLRNWLDRNGNNPGYDLLMEAIANGETNGEDFSITICDDYIQVYGNDANGEIPPEFWDHAEIVLGKKLTARPSFFSCSC